MEALANEIDRGRAGPLSRPCLRNHQIVDHETTDPSLLRPSIRPRTIVVLPQIMRKVVRPVPNHSREHHCRLVRRSQGPLFPNREYREAGPTAATRRCRLGASAQSSKVLASTTGCGVLQAVSFSIKDARFAQRITAAVMNDSCMNIGSLKPERLPLPSG